MSTVVISLSYHPSSRTSSSYSVLIGLNLSLLLTKIIPTQTQEQITFLLLNHVRSSANFHDIYWFKPVLILLRKFWSHPHPEGQQVCMCGGTRVWVSMHASPPLGSSWHWGENVSCQVVYSRWAYQKITIRFGGNPILHAFPISLLNQIRSLWNLNVSSVKILSYLLKTSSCNNEIL